MRLLGCFWVVDRVLRRHLKSFWSNSYYIVAWVFSGVCYEVARVFWAVVRVLLRHLKSFWSNGLLYGC